MKVLHAAAEIFPLVKTGGLADVLGALPQALAQLGADVRLILPGFPAILQGVVSIERVCEIGPCFGAGKVALLRGKMPVTDLVVYVVDAPYLYNRGGNPYLMPTGQEWPDNLQRFALLGWVAAHVAAGELDATWHPDILHCHDWHAAMACAYARANPVARFATVFTVHNLAYQGLFDPEDFHRLGLPASFNTPIGLEYHGQFSFMKAGLTCAGKVTTVSASYAAEIATAEFGCGLEGVVQTRGLDVSGILNGVDDVVWDSAGDTNLAATYSPHAMAGKRLCKAALQKAMGLKVDAAAPLFGIVSRLTPQKGLDLLLGAIPTLLAGGGQLAVQGSGDADLEAALTAVALANPGRVAVRLGYDEAFAHQMVAGSDALLVPSRFEPCGLTQLYALRYGTVPVVRHVGGLIDTVADATPEALQNQTATGFMFGPADAGALSGALSRATQIFAQKQVWAQLMQNGMAQRFSWASAARQYLTLYQEAQAAPEPGKV